MEKIASDYAASETLFGEVHSVLARRFGEPLHGGSLEGDWTDTTGILAGHAGFNALDDAVDDLAYLLVRADERYTNAREIAALAQQMEVRWQNGTRLYFQFIDAVDGAVEALEERLHPAHEKRAWGRFWCALTFHLTGESIRPVAPKPLVDMAAEQAGSGQ